MPAREERAGRPIWARKGVVIFTCPTSYVTAESQCLLEEFLARKRLGGHPPESLPARKAEAFFILERELSTEIRDAQQHTRHDL